MKLIYVAGAYRAKTDWRRQLNIVKAKVVGLQLLKKGYVPIIPHSMYANFDGECQDEVFLEADLTLLRVCEGVVLVPGWEESAGVEAELKEARSRQMPVFVSTDALVATESINESTREELSKIS